MAAAALGAAICGSATDFLLSAAAQTVLVQSAAQILLTEYIGLATSLLVAGVGLIGAVMSACIGNVEVAVRAADACFFLQHQSLRRRAADACIAAARKSATAAASTQAVFLVSRYRQGGS